MPFRADPGPIISRFRALCAAPEEKGPHTPHTLFIPCIDSRLLIRPLFGLRGNEAIIHQRIGAVIPPYEEADDQLLDILAFCKVNEIGNIILMAHSDCGGARCAALAPHDTTDHENSHIARIRRGIRRVGNAIEKFHTTFTHADEPPEDVVNELAKQVAMRSLRNLMAYPEVQEAVLAGKMNVSAVFYDIRHEELDVFDAKTGAFIHLSNFIPVNPDLKYADVKVCSCGANSRRD